MGREAEDEQARPPVEPRPVVVLTLDTDTSEIRALLDAIGFQPIGFVRQARPRPDPSTFLGLGKISEAKSLLEQRDPLVSPGRPLLVVDGAIKPPALFNLEDETNVEVWDRIRLILEIFQQHARVKEARLQVELARLRYELPFVHEALHRQLTGEHPGFMGGGEVETRTYETHLKRRTKTLTNELERVKRERRTRREGRRRGGMRLVAIAGYTNSGKSSLLNALTGSTVIARAQVFSTLQTATRKVRDEYRREGPNDLLFTDTVGFIRELPPWLIDAFASTLEEITQADALLFVIDASEPLPVIVEKIETAQDILQRIHAPRHRIVLLNKADLVSDDDRLILRERIHARLHGVHTPVLFTSTKTKEGLSITVDTLLDEILETRDAHIQLDLSLPDHARLENWVREHAQILDITEKDHHRRLFIRTPLRTWGPLQHRAKEAKADLEPSTRNKGAPLDL